jgi:hypothetical protein
MSKRRVIALIAIMLPILASGAAFAWDESKYPDWSGGWGRIGNGSFDGVTLSGPDEKAPLTPEYRARWMQSFEDQKKTGVSANPTERCLPPGMPRSMIVLNPMEIIITPKATYMLLTYMMEWRRIYTDGRDFPETAERTFSGYSIGTWEDSEGTGRYDTLNIETRFLKGPRTYGTSGIPFHDDNETIVKERLTLDKAKPGTMKNEITVYDHALTEPWKISRNYRHIKNPVWEDYICTENNNWVIVEGQNYYLSADGKLMPSVKGQRAPDLTYFEQRAK